MGPQEAVGISGQVVETPLVIPVTPCLEIGPRPRATCARLLVLRSTTARAGSIDGPPDVVVEEPTCALRAAPE